MKIGFDLSPSEALQNCWPDVFQNLTNRGHTVGLFVTRGSDPSRTAAKNDFVSFVEDFPVASDFARNVEPAAIAAANRFWRADSADRFRLVSLKLLNRVDFFGTFRFLDREAVLALAVLRAVATLQSNPIDLLVFEVTPHEFGPYVLQEVAKSAGVRTICFEPSPISPSLIVRGVELPPLAAVEESPIHREILSVATGRVRALRGHRVPKYIALQQDRDARLSRQFIRMRARILSLKWLFRPRFAESVGSFSGHGFGPGFLRRLAEMLLNRSLEQNLRRRAPRSEPTARPAPGSFALFALHYEPERTSLPDGLPVLFQGDAVLAAREILPDSVELVVKEHYSQTSSALRGYLGRSPLFYSYVSAIPQTRLVAGDQNATAYLSGSECVFTLTGTIAIEAVFQGVPVAYFGNPWWEGLPGTIRVGGSTTWDEVKSVRVPQPEEIQHFLEQLVSKKMMPGISAQSREFIERRMGPIPEGFFAAEASAMSSCIEAALPRASGAE